MYSSGYFAQVLEGPKSAIEQVFETIQRDPRHGDVTVLECANIEGRDFPQWSMARVQPVSDEQAESTTEALHRAMGQPGVAGQGVLELMRSLVIHAD